MDPTVRALVLVDEVTLGRVLLEDWGGFQGPVRLREATVLAREVVWQITDPPPTLEDHFPLSAPGELLARAQEGTWDGVTEALAGGSEVVLGLGGPDHFGVWGVMAIRLDGKRATFLGALGERFTGQVAAFLEWEGSPLRGGDPLDLLVAWNEEIDAARRGAERGPIMTGWGRFRRSFEGPSYPTVGSEEWWEAAPPHCRSIGDAPEGVLRGMEWTDVWVHLPESWRGVEDGWLCIRVTDVGAAGCELPTRVKERYPYLHFDEVYAQPGSQVRLVYARKVNGYASWVRHEILADVSFTTFRDAGGILIELPASAPASFDELRAEPERYRGEVRVLSLEENEELSDVAIPKAEPCPAEEDC